MITGLSHMTFIVSNLDKTSMFWKTIFDAKEVYASGSDTFSISEENFFLAGDIWICIMKGKPLTERSYNHIAFCIEESEFDDYLKKINDVGAEIKSGRPRVDGEGRSVYFYDFDNHLFELHTGNLATRLQRYNS